MAYMSYRNKQEPCILLVYSICSLKRVHLYMIIPKYVNFGDFNTNLGKDAAQSYLSFDFKDQIAFLLLVPYG